MNAVFKVKEDEIQTIQVMLYFFQQETKHIKTKGRNINREIIKCRDLEIMRIHW